MYPESTLSIPDVKFSPSPQQSPSSQHRIDEIYTNSNVSSSFSYASPSLSEKSITTPSSQISQESDTQSSASSTPKTPNSLTESKDQISSINQRATELQFIVQQLISTHVPEQNRFLLLPSLDEDSPIPNDSNSNIKSVNINTIKSPSLNQKQQLLLLKQDQFDLTSLQYDYDCIKDILNQSLFYNDICDVPKYFREIYDTAYQDGVLNVGIDAEEFFIFA